MEIAGRSGITMYTAVIPYAQGIELKELVSTFERQILSEVLMYTRGNRNQAAKLLGIPVTIALRKFAVYGLNKEIPYEPLRRVTRTKKVRASHKARKVIPLHAQARRKRKVGATRNKRVA